MDLRYTELVNDQYGITIKVDNVLFSGHSKFQKVDVTGSLDRWKQDEAIGAGFI